MLKVIYREFKAVDIENAVLECNDYILYKGNNIKRVISVDVEYDKFGEILKVFFEATQ